MHHSRRGNSILCIDFAQGRIDRSISFISENLTTILILRCKTVQNYLDSVLNQKYEIM